MGRQHIFHQGPVLKTLARTAWGALSDQIQAVSNDSKKSFELSSLPSLPGPIHEIVVPARPASLVRDYIRHLDGDPKAYGRQVPGHLFPQWSFPIQAQALESLPFSLIKILNGGCRLQMNAPLELRRALRVQAQLESISQEGNLLHIHQKIVTSHEVGADNLVAHLRALVPLPTKKKLEDGAKQKKRKAPILVPLDAREIHRWKLRADAGFQYATFSGDFNPVHWVRPYARAFGFRSTILHGFAEMARAIESLNRKLYSGAVDRIEMIDVQFRRPLTLPAKVGLFIGSVPDSATDQKASSSQSMADKQNLLGVYLGAAPGAPANMVGYFSSRHQHKVSFGA